MKQISGISSRLPRFGAPSPILRRFLWKDLRTLRNLWIGVATATMLLLGMTLCLLPDNTIEVAQAVIPWGAGAIYALGSAISLFATEREDRTDGFLLLLPRFERSLLAGKALAAAVTSLALVVVVGLASVAFTGGRPPDGALAAQVSANGSLIMLEWFVWGIAVSLLCPHPLLAAVIAIAAAALSAELAFAASSPQEFSLWLARDQIAAPQRLLVVAVIAALDVHLGLRWLDPPRPRRRKTRETPVAAEVLVLTPHAPALFEHRRSGMAATLASYAGGTRSPTFLRLLWQAGCEALLPMLAALPAGLLLTSTVVIVAEGIARAGGGVSLAPLGWLIVPALMGSLAFRADQRDHSYEFLHVRGARPAAVWASRHAVWLTATLFVALVVQVALLAIQGPPLWRLIEQWPHALRDAILPGPGLDPEAVSHEVAAAWESLIRQSLLLWSATFAAYGCGQLGSMMIRSSVAAAFAAVFLSMLVAAWCHLVELWQLPAAWYVGAIGVVTLAATLVGCRPWLAERARTRRWAPAAAAFTIGLTFVAAALPRTRMAQFEGLASPLGPLELPQILSHWSIHERQEADAVAAHYNRLAASIEQSRAAQLSSVAPFDEARQDTLLKACHHEFDDLARISGARRCRVPSSPAAPNESRNLHQLVTWLQDDASRHIEVGNLAAALTRIMSARRISAHAAQYQPSQPQPDVSQSAATARHESLLSRWSIAPGQTGEMLRDAIRQLGECEQLQPAVYENVVADYLRIRELLLTGDIAETALAHPFAEPSHQGAIRLAAYAQHFPGERDRALAALLFLTDARLDYVEAVTHWQASPSGSRRPAHRIDELRRLLHPNADWTAGSSRTPRVAARPSWDHADEPYRLRRAIEASETSILPALALSQGGSLVEATTSWLDALARRRGEMIRLALVAYRFKHRAYPETLSALLDRDDQQQSYLHAQAILDPYTGRPFEYRPHGLSHPVAGSNDTTLDEMLPAGTPMIWSVGASFVRLSNAWVAESRTEDGWPTIIPAKEPAHSLPSPPGEISVQVIKFYAGTDAPNRGPILLILPK
jgi:hypothetical protein